MSAESSLTNWRARLLLLIAPGILVVLGAVVSYFAGLGMPSIDFGKWKLLLGAGLGVVLAGGGFLLHLKAVADFQKVKRAYWNTVLFVLASVLLLPSLTVLALDKVIGLFLLVSAPMPVLVLPPHSKVSYETSEFQFTAETNALGFRDREVDLQRKPKFRALAIGDSFTYGWGVELADSWPKVLERRLRAAGQDAEVLNLGCPGTSVDAYAEIAEHAIPLLKPDLVIIAVLQGDDVKQLDLGTTSQKLADPDGSHGPSQARVASVLPNLYEIRTRFRVRKPSVLSANEMRQEWRRLAKEIEDHLNAEEKERFASVDAEVKTMLMNGDFNPWEVYNAVKYPDYMAFTLNPERAEVRKATNLMAGCLARIKQAAEWQGAGVMVVSVPPGWYVCARALAYKRRVGFRLEDESIHSDAPDAVIRSACQEARVDFESCTSHFRKAAADRNLYYDFDGHFNSKGQAQFGEQVAEMVLRRKD